MTDEHVCKSASALPFGSTAAANVALRPSTFATFFGGAAFDAVPFCGGPLETAVAHPLLMLLCDVAACFAECDTRVASGTSPMSMDCQSEQCNAPSGQTGAAAECATHNGTAKHCLKNYAARAD